MSEAAERPWLTVAAAHAEHGVSTATLKRWAQRGLVTARQEPQLGGYHWEIEPASLEARLADRPKSGPRKRLNGKEGTHDH